MESRDEPAPSHTTWKTPANCRRRFPQLPQPPPATQTEVEVLRIRTWISLVAGPQHQPDRTLHLLKKADKLTCYRQFHDFDNSTTSTSRGCASAIAEHS